MDVSSSAETMICISQVGQKLGKNLKKNLGKADISKKTKTKETRIQS